MNKSKFGITTLKNKIDVLKDKTEYTTVRLSPNFLKSFGISSFDRPTSVTAATVLMYLTQYVDNDFKIHANLDTLYKEMNINRSELYLAARESLIKHGYIIKRLDGYFLTSKSHVRVSNKTNEQYVKNLKILSNYQILKTLTLKQLSFLYFLIGQSYLPQANYYRTYDVCSLYENRFQNKEKIKFNLFKSTKELVEAILKLYQLGLIQATFSMKSQSASPSIKFKDSYSLNEHVTADAMSVLSYLGYTYTQNKTLMRNPGIQNFKIGIKVLVENNDEYVNRANFEEFKNELAVYGLEAENVFSSENKPFNVKDNAINLFIDLKNEMINTLGVDLGIKIYRDALRYYLSEKNEYLYGYNAAGVGKAINIFKKYYLLPYLQTIIEKVFNDNVNGILLDDSDIKLNIAMYNVNITHDQFNKLVEYYAQTNDIAVLTKVVKPILDIENIQSQLSKQYPSITTLFNKYKTVSSNFYKKHVQELKIDMSFNDFEQEVLHATVQFLDKQSMESFDRLIEKLLSEYQQSINEQSLANEVEKYQHSMAAMRKHYFKKHVEAVVNGSTAYYQANAPQILEDVCKEVFEDLPLDQQIAYSKESHTFLINKAKILFDTKIEIDVQKNISKVSFYNWLEERE